MSEIELGELEGFLYAFALGRYFNKRANVLGIKKLMRKITKCQVVAFIRCIELSNVPISFTDLTMIVDAETYSMMNFIPRDGYGTAFTPEQLGREIHQWLLYLQENRKLPGIYERYTGRFIPEK